MKFVFTFSACLIFCTIISAQNNFQSSSPYTGTIVTVNGNDVMLPSYNTNHEKIEGSSYFAKDWVPGSVTTTDNNVFSSNLLFMYDKANNGLYYKKQDSDVTWKVDLSKVSAFSLSTDRPHIFMKADYFSRDYTGAYFEVLLLDEKKYSLVKYVRTSFQQTTTSKASQAMMENFSTGKYVDDITYFLFKGGRLAEVVLKKKKLEEALGADADKAQPYFKAHGGGLNEQAAISLLTEVNAGVN